MKKLNQILETNWGNPARLRTQFKSILSNNLSKHYQNYSDREHEAIKEYTENGSSIVNRHLWDQHLGGGYNNSRSLYSEKLTPHLDAAIQRHKTPHKLSLWAGTKYDPRKVAKDKIVHHPGYLSTSLDPDTARSFAKTFWKNKKDSTYEKHVLKFKIPKGHIGAFVDHISKNEGEHEFILPCGLNLRHKYTLKNVLSDGDTINEHHMEIV